MRKGLSAIVLGGLLCSGCAHGSVNRTDDSVEPFGYLSLQYSLICDMARAIRALPSPELEEPKEICYDRTNACFNIELLDSLRRVNCDSLTEKRGLEADSLMYKPLTSD